MRPAVPPTGRGDLECLIRRALERRPELEAARREAAARLAASRQAERHLNPNLALEVEDFAGRGALSGFDGAQTTVSLSQVIERGGKREARSDVARVHAQLAELEGTLLAREVEAQVRRAFWRALQRRGQLELARALEQTTTSFLVAVRERVGAGTVSPIEESKYSVAAACARLGRREAERALERALSELARSVGDDAPISALEGEFGQVGELPPLAELRASLGDGPRRALLELEAERARAEVSRAESEGALDLELRLGLRRFEATDEHAAVVGVVLPLPVFDRKRDARAAARERQLRAAALRDAHELDLGAALGRAWARLAGAHADLRALEDGVLRDSAWVSSAVDEGYRRGKFGLLEALDAQRTDYEVRSRHLRALAEYHVARTDIEALLCHSLDR